MGHSVLVQPAKLHVVSLISFPGNLNEHALHASAVIYRHKSVPLLKYINGISILKRQAIRRKFFFNCVIHISSPRYTPWPAFMQYVLGYDCLVKIVTSRGKVMVCFKHQLL